MGRFNLHYKKSEYKKPVDKGSFVYIYDVDCEYEAQTVYKVAYYDKKLERILVEVDPKKNFIDSDYIKGFDGEVSCQCILFDWLCVSAGADMLMGKGKVSLDYQLGVGVNIPLGKLFNNKKK